ncbi:hypothetical protein ACHAWO_008088 [Cyclotella atomus]|uniref:Uncharacterized protein n=1 Tax=Cyclotella atomus TaxID=382360 RepID=A0ABD3PS25_9STRA
MIQLRWDVKSNQPLEQGDWSAVGATAAMIALLPDEDSTNSAYGEYNSHLRNGSSRQFSNEWNRCCCRQICRRCKHPSGPPPSDHGSVSHHRNNSISMASVETVDESSVMTQSNYSGRTSQINATESEYSARLPTREAIVTRTLATGNGHQVFGTGTNSGTYETELRVANILLEVSRELTNPSEDRNSSLTSSRSLPGSSSYKTKVSHPRLTIWEGKRVDSDPSWHARKDHAQRAKAAVQRSKKERGGRCLMITLKVVRNSPVRDSTFTGSATSVNDPMSMASASHSITEEFVDGSSRSGSESEYSSESANETEEGSRSEQWVEYGPESQSSADGYNKSNIGSVVSQDISKENPDELDNLMDSGDWHGIGIMPKT